MAFHFHFQPEGPAPALEKSSPPPASHPPPQLISLGPPIPKPSLLLGDFALARCIVDSDKVSNSSSDVVHSPDGEPVYEGGAKLWESTTDLLSLMHEPDFLFPPDATVLDLGCGCGLLGIAALRKGARRVVFQDLNTRVLEMVTSANLHANFAELDAARVTLISTSWSSLLHASLNQPDSAPSLGTFDLILSSETLYRPRDYATLTALLHKLLAKDGSALLASKRFYFGAQLGGGSQAFAKFAEERGLEATIVRSAEEGVKRDILRLSVRQGSDVTS
jgi:SAM-dependent methyltransferase